MPELGWYLGYPLLLLLMLLIAATMIAYFWRRGWLRRVGSPASRAGTSESERETSPHSTSTERIRD
jgi:magnesium transporter